MLVVPSATNRQISEPKRNSFEPRTIRMEFSDSTFIAF